MTNYARIIDNVAIDVSVDPDSQFHPDIAKDFVEVPDTVKHGWRRNGGNWTAPAAPVAPAPTPPIVSITEFMLLFTNAERVSAKSLRASDPMIEDFWSMLDDPRTTVVNLALASVQDGIEYVLDAIGADVATRKAEILTGIVK